MHRWQRMPIQIVFTILLIAASCSGGKGNGPSRDAGDQACPVDFATAEGMSCANEGQSCSSGGCSNQCDFCNILSCESGQWNRLEAFPSRCFSCGDAQCVTDLEFCRLEQPPLDDPCVNSATDPNTQAICPNAVTCECLEQSVTEFATCEESNPGEVVILISP